MLPPCCRSATTPTFCWRYCVSVRRAWLDEPGISVRTAIPRTGSIQDSERPSRNGTPGGAGSGAGTPASQDSCRRHPAFLPAKFLRTTKEGQKSRASTIQWPSSRLISFSVTNFPWSVPDPPPALVASPLIGFPHFPCSLTFLGVGLLSKYIPCHWI